MPDVGDVTTPTLTVSPFGVSTAATLTIYKPDGTTSSPTASTSDAGQTWTTTSVIYDTAGWWVFTWTVTGTGAGTEPQHVYVGPVQALPPNLPPIYASLEALKRSLNIPVADTGNDEDLLAKLMAASRGIDDFCDRRFWLDTTATAKTINPRRRVIVEDDGERLLLPWDIGSTTSLVVEIGSGSSWTAVTDYETDPDGALNDNKPVTGLLRTAGVWQLSPTQRVRITARWGYPILPQPVTDACLLQAARLFKRRQSPEGVLGNSEFGLIRVARLDPDVAEQVGRLARSEVG